MTARRHKQQPKRRFFAFLAISCIVSVAAAIFTVFTPLKNDIERINDNGIELESQLIAQSLKEYLNTHLALTKDLAEAPIITNSVMGSTISAIELRDHLSKYRFLGQRQAIALYNLAGDAIYLDDNANLPTSLSGGPLLDVMLSGENDRRIDFISPTSQNEHPSARFTLPVYYRDSTVEGVLMVSFSNFFEHISQQLVESIESERQLVLYGDGGVYKSQEPKANDDFVTVHSISLDDLGVQIDYRVDTTSLRAQQFDTLAGIGLSILLSIVLSFALILLLGLRIVVNPFRALEESESQLREAQDRWHLVLEATNEGIYDWTPRDNQCNFSGRYRELLGYESHDTTAFPNQLDSFLTHLHPDDKPLVLAALEAHRFHQQPYSVVFRLRHRSGHYLRFMDRGKGRFNEQGEMTRMSGAIQDITDKYEAEEALREAKQQNDLLKQAVDVVNVGVSIADATQKDLPLIYVNDAFSAITGYAKEEVIGVNCRFMSGENTSDNAIKAIRQALSKQRDMKVELINYRKDGTSFWNALQLSPVLDEEGNLKAYIGIQQDITQQRRLAEDLLQAKTRAESADKAKSEFLASMSHELRTPMNGVLGMLDVLDDSELSNKQRHYLSTAKKSAQSLLRLLNDILDLSKLESGKVTLERIGFDIESTVEEALGTLTLSAHNKNLSILVDSSALSQPVKLGDPIRVRQILINLLGNAIKFTKEGHIKLTVADSGADNNGLTLEVEDTGIGIDTDNLSKLFKEFEQLDSSTTRQYGGSGLGLAIVKRLTDLMRGTIEVDSKVDQGTHFKVQLPLTSSEQGHCLLSPNLNGDCIIIDPYPPRGELLESQAKLAGMTACYVSNPAAAHSYLAQPVAADQNRIILIHDTINAESLHHFLTLAAEHNWKTGIVTKSIDKLTSFSGYVDDVMFEPVTPKSISEGLFHLSGYTDNANIESEKPPSFDADFGTIKILIAEDNPLNRHVFESMLSQLNIVDIIFAHHGEEALRLLEQHLDVDLVFMDCQMPHMDGYEATRLIRQGKVSGVNHSLPIIAVTANAMATDREKCLNAGMNDYISKPYSKSDIINTLNKWVNGAESSATSADKHHDNDTPQELWHPTQAIDAYEDENLVCELVHITIEQYDEEIREELASAMEEQDSLKLEKVTHKLKGSAGQMYCTPLHNALTELNDHCKGGQFNWETDRATVSDMIELAERTIEAMEHWLSHQQDKWVKH